MNRNSKCLSQVFLFDQKFYFNNNNNKKYKYGTPIRSIGKAILGRHY